MTTSTGFPFKSPKVFIKRIKDNINSGTMSLFYFPSQSQAVERTFKFVTEIASNICVNKRRNAFIKVQS